MNLRFLISKKVKLAGTGRRRGTLQSTVHHQSSAAVAAWADPKIRFSHKLARFSPRTTLCDERTREKLSPPTLHFPPHGQSHVFRFCPALCPRRIATERSGMGIIYTYFLDEIGLVQSVIWFLVCEYVAGMMVSTNLLYFPTAFLPML